MVDLDTLEFRRIMQLIAQYLSIIRNKIDCPTLVGSISLLVPTRVGRDEAGAVAPRRRPRLLDRPVSRTRRGAHAPTKRALRLVGDMLARHEDIDLFADHLGHISDKARIFINNILCK